MKRVWIAVALTGVCCMSAFAVESAPKPERPSQDFGQLKGEILGRIEERIARGQEEKACVQAAQTPEELRACRDKFRPERQEARQARREGRQDRRADCQGRNPENAPSN